MKIYLKAYLAENFGDDLFVQILMKRYPNHEFYAVSDGFDSYKKYSNLKVYSNHLQAKVIGKFKLEKYIANKCDMVLTIGGSMFIENNDKDKYAEFTIGKNKHYILGTNFGPYKTKEYFENVKEALRKSEDVCFREKYSYELFKDLNNVRYASDIVFLADVSSNSDLQSDKKVIISVIDCAKKAKELCKEKYENKIVEMINFFDKEGYKIELVSLCKFEGDEEAVNSILNKCDEELARRIEKYFYRGNLEEAIKIFANSEIVVGTRFHANIVGALLGKKIIPICYSKKTENVLNDMDFNGVVLDIDEIDKFDINNLNDLSRNKVENIESNIEKANLQFEKLDKVLLK